VIAPRTVSGNGVDPEREAWNALVERAAGQLWDVARAAGCDEGTASAICQLAWLRLGQALDNATVISDPIEWLLRFVSQELELTRCRADARAARARGARVVNIDQSGAPAPAAGSPGGQRKS
jgi:DNA-directed RNA polymerase specialized sigma24 family protein